MTPEQRDLVMALAVVPGRPEPISGDDFLHRFGATDGKELGRQLLADAVQRRDAIDVELSLLVGFRFGFTMTNLPLLTELCYAGWHQRHEDVVSALATLKSPDSIDALVHVAEWVPDYLAFDDARALATKAIWALGAIDDEAADGALAALAVSDDGIVSKGALAQIARRRGTP